MGTFYVQQLKLDFPQATPTYIKWTLIKETYTVGIFYVQHLKLQLAWFPQATPTYIKWTLIKDTYSGYILCTTIKAWFSPSHTHLHKMDPYKRNIYSGYILCTTFKATTCMISPSHSHLRKKDPYKRNIIYIYIYIYTVSTFYVQQLKLYTNCRIVPKPHPPT